MFNLIKASFTEEKLERKTVFQRLLIKQLGVLKKKKGQVFKNTFPIQHLSSELQWN